ncbi:ABC transporter permease [Numidum massiliense]|uniref:ABC transporter permease n=1 Tax=Numidum massiliense TaxID=1522315 RepID=UPI0006D568E7|nr:ABC transporter permease [Numidum massiliense]
MENIISFLNESSGLVLEKIWEHLYISFIAVLLGALLAIPLAIVLTRMPKTAKVVLGVAGVLQTIPSLAMLAFFIPVLGLGTVPAISALFLYSILPILQNTYTGISEVNSNLVQAGRGMGMTTWELVRDVEIPLAMPTVMAGVRVATVYIIGWATLASFIGAGGLGDLIFTGLDLYRTELVVAGAIPATAIALIADFLLSRLERRATPIGLRKMKQTAAS